eukprot:scaffold32992_cov48-Phaeocystis_antarctica.AAC.1
MTTVLLRPVSSGVAHGTRGVAQRGACSGASGPRHTARGVVASPLFSLLPSSSSNSPASNGVPPRSGDGAVPCGKGMFWEPRLSPTFAESGGAGVVLADLVCAMPFRPKSSSPFETSLAHALASGVVSRVEDDTEGRWLSPPGVEETEGRCSLLAADDDDSPTASTCPSSPEEAAAWRARGGGGGVVDRHAHPALRRRGGDGGVAVDHSAGNSSGSRSLPSSSLPPPPPLSQGLPPATSASEGCEGSSIERCRISCRTSSLGRRGGGCGGGCGGNCSGRAAAWVERVNSA